MSDAARTTERLTLRPPGPGDAPAYRALLMHPTIGFDHLLFRTVPRSTASRQGGLDSGR